jgi:hypothetical protein
MFRSLVAAALVLLVGASGARAGFLYTWGGSPFAVPSTGGTRNGAIYLELPGDAPAPPPIAPVLVRAFTALANGRDVYTNSPYSLTFRVSDPRSGQSHTVTLRGEFNGTVTSSSVNLRNTFLGGTGFQSFDFLNHDYTVTFGFRSSFGSPLRWRGDITASVAVSAFESVSAVAAPVPAPAVTPPEPLVPPPPGAAPAAAPEPAACVLAALALPALGLVAWRRRGALGAVRAVAAR